MSFDQFTKEVLEPFTGKSICVCDKESGATLSELQIEKVTETESGEFDSLSVILKGNPEVQLPQNTYTFKSEAFDEVELFMVPNSVDSYQIIVSRKKS
ncbi:DUF6916 family protein [Vibrio quintilis]|uniref:DUF6916 domain-containing protein n=1 Tax=Vibrio quintilis TaxID=1117707 RepID=A0A1M7YYX0_9VIBR|nr:hypothetical protein [Vibrio quintilis]SHO57841.1 hypothetical protein VQ7734_03611 [Vibrio quintilis]